MGTCLLSWLSIPKKNYIDSFFNVINWPKVGENYEAAFRKILKSILYKNADAPIWQCISIFYFSSLTTCYYQFTKIVTIDERLEGAILILLSLLH
jgi:hypothetical protein